MRFAIPSVLFLSLALLAGCAATSSTEAPAESACATCASGEYCAECDAKKGKSACATCAAGEKCTDCAAQDGKACTVCGGDATACATCAAGEPCAKCDAKKSEAKPSASDTEPVATINAKGMGCPLCASSADRRLKKVDGVKWTNIDLGNGVVTVGLDPEKPAPAAEDLQAAIRDAGFTADDVTMPDGEVTQ